MEIERRKLLVRLELCKQELKRAKDALRFWSRELGLVVDAIVDDTQGCFDFETGEVDNGCQSGT